MIVCIAEKPSVAKDIAQIIGATQRKEGFWEGNNYCVTWTFGHLCTLKEPHDYSSQWKKWQVNSLPMLPQKFGIKLIENRGIETQFNIIKELVGKCEGVINCGDAGQEGELIQRWVLAKAGLKQKMKRLWISSLTEEAIKEGFKNLKPAENYDNLYAAGMSRAIGDWLLGMNATRLFTLKYAGKNQIFSIGRVQTPTLAMIVNRQNEIENFVPETYFEIKTKYRNVEFSCKKGSFKTQEKASDVIDKIKEADFIISSFKIKEGKELPPKLFDLTSLQVECNKKINLTAENTLNTVQKLYEKKLVTYPRVDTTYLPDDVYPKIKEILQKLKPYEKFTSQITGSKIRKSKKVFDNKKVTDHHAIIPTGIYPSGLSLQEKQVYDIITRRFIAAFFPDCKVSNTTVEGEAAQIGFKTTGKQILDKGWRVLFETSEKSSDETPVLPLFEKGESGPHVPAIAQKQTSPPKYFSEATLLRSMETAGKNVDDDEIRDLMKENGIGRPSTRANIIETLFKREYIKREKKRIVATPTGKQLISLISNDLLKSAELTGNWERKLRDIEKGELDVNSFKNELYKMVGDLIHEVKTGKPELTCPKCNKHKVISGKSAWGCAGHKEGCNFRIPFLYEGIKLSHDELSSLITKRESSYSYFVNNEQGRITLSDDFKLGFESAVKKV